MSQTLLRPDTPALRASEGYAASSGRTPGERSERPRRAAWAAIVTVASIVALGGTMLARLDDGAAPAAPLPEELPLGSMYHVADQIGARQLWAGGITGAGVNVAVIDTGVAPVPGLDAADKVAAVVDLSTERFDDEARFVDGHGHGTHLAGIIAGRSAGTNPAATDGFAGIAPDAGIVSVKVAGRDGDVTPAAVVSGIDWVIEHAAELDIRVISLALDTGYAGPYGSDPLAAAVERAWDAGIVVVTAAGNEGAESGGLNLPASDPHVIAVGGVRAIEGGFEVPDWASAGDGVRNPDLAAPGAHIQSLRVPGSDADLYHPEGHVENELLFKGSGSSQAAAVVAGGAALLLQADPTLTPDQVKAALVETATPLAGAAAEQVGHGLLNLPAAADADVADARQEWPAATATRPLPQPAAVAVNPHWAGASWAGASWAGASWAGASWAGASWAGASWAGASWAGASWAGASWA